MSMRKEPQAENAPQLTMKLGKTINRLRRAYNYSLGDLSEQSGVAKSIISQIEKNETNPTLGTIYKLARALNAPIEEILRGEDAPALVEKLGPSGTPLLVSEDGRCRLRIIGWIKTVELVQWYHFEAEPTASHREYGRYAGDSADGQPAWAGGGGRPVAGTRRKLKSLKPSGKGGI
jgi:transcriptional regulator with XRE-family HTH domain